MKRPVLVLAVMAALASGAEAQQRDPLEQFVDGAEIGCQAFSVSGGVDALIDAFKRPIWPAASQRAEEEGKVRIGVCISELGRPLTVKLLQPPNRAGAIRSIDGRPKLAPREFSESPRLQKAMADYACRRRYPPAVDAEGKRAETCNVVIEYTWRKEDYPKLRPPNIEEAAVAVNSVGR